MFVLIFNRSADLTVTKLQSVSHVKTNINGKKAILFVKNNDINVASRFIKAIMNTHLDHKIKMKEKKTKML